MIGLVSINEDRNYGAVLQAVGLQKYLCKIGISGKFVCLEKNYNGVLSFSFNSPKDIIKNYFTLIHYKKLKDGCMKFQSFIEANQESFQKYSTIEQLGKEPPDVSGYIVGSDQVWPEDNLTPLYSLLFAQESTVKISYAASMGKDIISDSKKSIYKEYLERFDAISVREKNAVKTVSEVFSGQVDYHIDPTLLHDMDFWVEFEQPYDNLPEKFILIYMIYVPSNVNDRLREIKAKTGLPIVLVSNTPYKKIKCDYYIRDAGPAEFLWLIHHAQGIISSSYHGVIFSMIYKKPFIAVVNPNNGSRLNNLLQLLHMEHHNNWNSSFLKAEYDYNSIVPVLNTERNRSRSFFTKWLI